MNGSSLFFFIQVIYAFALVNVQNHKSLYCAISIDYARKYHGDAHQTLIVPYLTKSNKVVRSPVSCCSESTYKGVRPSGAMLVSEQSTSTDYVSFETAGSDVSFVNTPRAKTLSQASSRKTLSKVRNVVENSGFEQDYLNWYTSNSSGYTTFSIDRANPGAQIKSARVVVTVAGPHSWSSQINRNIYDLEDNNTYILKFMARADANGRKMGANILNPKVYSIYAAKTYLITDQWQTYSLPVSLAAGVNSVLVTLDIGYEAGTFWFDEVTFGKARVTSTPIKPSEKLIPTFTIAPNPIVDQFVLQHNPLEGKIQIYKLTITDMQGRTQWASVLISPAANHPIDVSTLPAGQYVLSVSDGVKQESLKLLKR